MIISMKLHATRQEIDEVRKQVEHFGYKVHSIEGEERVVIGVVGVGDVTACMESIEAMPQVDNVVRISAPYKFVSKEFRAGKTKYASGGRRGESGRENAARRRVQAANFAIRFSGNGRRRLETAEESQRGN